jgi:uncharacterized OsmC-like protein
MWDLPEYLLRKREKVEAMRERLRANSAPTPLRATARVAAGSGVRPVRVREFTIVTDAGAGLGGFELGPTAPELLLSALASCLAHSFVVVAADHGLAFTTLEVEVTGQIDYRGTLAVDPQASVPPSELAYAVRYESEAPREAVEAVWREVEQLCPVLQALVRPLEVRGSLVPSERS